MLIKKLDKRISKNTKAENKKIYYLAPSQFLSPINAPVWSLKDSCNTSAESPSQETSSVFSTTNW